MEHSILEKDFLFFGIHSFASAIPPGVMAKVASDSGKSGLETRQEDEH